MPTWPVTVIQEPSADGYEETYLESAIHSGMSVGRKNRLRDPSVVKTYKVKVLANDDQRDAIHTFWSTTLRSGTLPFDWIKFDDGSTAASYRMLSDPDLVAVSSGVWKVSLSLIDAEPQRVIDTTIVPAAASWPSSLPQGGAVGAWRESWNGYSLRSGIMPGKTARSRSTFIERRLTIQAMVNLTQKRTFEGFYEDDLVLGTKTFTHTGWTTSGASERYVMLAPPKFAGLGAGLFTLTTEVVTA